MSSPTLEYDLPTAPQISSLPPALPDVEHVRSALTQALAGFSARLNLDSRAAMLTEKPAESTLVALGLSTLLFYVAERRTNPKVGDIWDSLVYCSTCLSVGYGDIFARTPLGKLIGSALMTIGPALSSGVLSGASDRRSEAQQSEIVDTLKEILAELRSMQPT